MVKDDEPTDLPPLYIRERMRDPRITGDTLAERMGTTPATVSRLLNGKRKMTLEWLFAFSKALAVPIETLFTPPGERQDQPITSEPEILAFLSRIKDFTPADIDAAFGVIMLAFRAKRGGSQSGEDRDRSAQSNPLHESEPSR